jgi:hypothetical protein
MPTLLSCLIDAIKLDQAPCILKDQRRQLE